MKCKIEKTKGKKYYTKQYLYIAKMYFLSQYNLNNTDKKKMIYSTLTEIIIPYIYDKCVIFCNNCLGLLYLPLDMKQTNFVPESKYIRIHNNPNITIESNPTFTAIISLNFIIIAPIIMGVIIAIAARLNPHFVSVIQ